MRIIHNRRELINIELEEINHWDAPDYCDAFIVSAAWADTGSQLTDEELDELNEDKDLVHNAVYQYIY